MDIFETLKITSWNILGPVFSVLIVVIHGDKENYDL